jgi:hypothetical protein
MASEGVVLYNQIQALIQGVNTQLLRRPIIKGTVTDRVCWVRQNVKGSQVVFPVRFFSNAPKARSPYSQVPATAVEIVNFFAAMQRVAPDQEIIPYDTELADLYGVFQAMTDVMLAQAGNEYEYQLANMLGYGQSATVVIGSNGFSYGGPTSYDSLPYFNAAKLVNPNRPSVGTFPNYYPGLDIGRAGLVQAFQQLDGVKGPDGRIMRMPGKIVVIVSTEDQFDRASVYLHGTIRATDALTPGVAQASESNPDADKTEGGEGGGLKGRAELVKLPDLIDFDGGKGWYAVKIASAEHRPLTVNVVKSPLLFTAGLSPDALIRAISDNLRMGWWANFGLGYAWPHLAVKALEN